MDWFLWTLVGWWVFGAVVAVAQVGRPRKPLEPGVAAMMVLFYALFIGGLLVTR